MRAFMVIGELMLDWSVSYVLLIKLCILCVTIGTLNVLFSPAIFLGSYQNLLTFMNTKKESMTFLYLIYRRVTYNRGKWNESSSAYQVE